MLLASWFLAVQGPLDGSYSLSWGGGGEEEEGTEEEEEVILAFWAVECYAIVPEAIHKYCSAFSSIVGHIEHAEMLKC